MLSKVNYSIIVVLALILSLLFISSCDKKTYEPVIPSLELSTNFEEFTAPVGGPSPGFFFVHVTTDLDQKVTFSFTEHSSWISLANARGVPFGDTPDSFLVEFKVSSPIPLDVGEHVDTIFVTSDEVNNSPQIIEIKLNMISTLQVEPFTLNFSAARDGFNPPNQYFKIFSISSEQFDYNLETNASWINLPQASGTTSTTDSISVEINSSGLSEGTYVDSIKISSATAFNSPIFLPCSLSVSPWMTQVDPNGSILLDLFFEDEQNGWAVGFIGDAQSQTGYILNTTNSGLSWEMNYFAGTHQGRSTEVLGAVQFFGQTGWVVGKSGLIFKTTDHGLNWNVIESGFVDSLIDYNNLHFVSQDTGWLVGDSGFIIKTVDGGQSWSKQTSGTQLDLSSVTFVDSESGWAAGGIDVVLHTANGGISWVKQSVPLSPSPNVGDNYDFNDIFFINANIGWAVGKQGHIVSTIDGGQSWIQTQISLDGIKVQSKLSSIFFINNSIGWISGENGLILYTNDGGMNWSQQLSNTTSWLNSIYFLNANVGWVVGAEGTIRYTGSGGN